MAEYRTTDSTGQTVYVERRGGAGRVILGVLVVALIIVAALFATGFFSAHVTKSGSLPTVAVSAKGGSMPKVDLDSKKVVVGTKHTTVDVPKVETKKEEVSVPVLGVTDGKKD
ncbi:hypothetical protein [uncultured Sphingomonas sp.]|uniref:hypothetical protein n=1 Tax=uncultured Sphingomonas sp. TaxID=158754 RepID=UPI0035CADA26